jgi:hypothetical protein
MRKTTIERPRLTLVTCLTALAVIIILSIVLVLLIQLSFPADAGKSPIVTQALTVIPAPSVTIPIILPTVPPNTNVTVVPTPLPAGQMGIGAYVQISGTGGDGLRLRSGPGTTFSPLFLGMESEVFKVTDGPKDADGFTWWFLVAPYDDNRKGWAVQNYLSVISDKPTAQP